MKVHFIKCESMTDEACVTVLPQERQSELSSPLFMDAK